MLQTIISYIKFRLASVNAHGVHSPFVYNLLTKGMVTKAGPGTLAQLKDYRDKLLKNNNRIQVTDLGAGSRVSNAPGRRIRAIARTSGTPLKRQILMYNLCGYLKCRNLLELGTSLGLATYAMSLGNSEARITTVEGCPNISAFTRSAFEELNLSTISLVNQEFGAAIKNLDRTSFDLIFIDGNHQKEATLHYFESLLPYTHNDTVMIFDDIYWSKHMTEAWKKIIKHPKVTVSIDTFHWGLIFFRKEQAREHFKIRI